MKGPPLARRPVQIGWFEEYGCGCTSETVKYKKELVGYCGKHGDDRIHLYPDVEWVKE